MANRANFTDRIRSFLVLAAALGTIAFNALASAGYVGGVTPGEISDKYPTIITPSGYAFSIWSLIYVGILAFSIYQLLPANLDRLRVFRSPFILSCALNCAWIFFWHSDQIAICLVVIAALLGTLIYIVYKARDAETIGETWFVKAPFGLYAGWVTAATLVNLAVLLRYMQLELGGAESVFGVAMVLLAAGIGVFYRVYLRNFIAPAAIAWALTAIAIKQSGQTLVVSAAAVGVIACLIAAFSFVMNLKSSADEQR
jgi:translocator protein